jgi:hypothetical protein
MTASNHVVFGALVAAVVQEPLIALPLAFASHFALDAMPHFGEKKLSLSRLTWILIPDMILAATILIWIAVVRPIHWPLLIACGILAASPDLMWLPNYIRGLRKMPLKTKKYLLMRFHAWVQWGEYPWGYVIEIPWFVLSVYLLYMAAR